MRRPPPCANRARHDGDAAKRGQRAALQILRRDIFKRLPARQHVDPVANFGISSDGADLGIGKPADEPRYGRRLELRIGIEHHDDIAGLPAPGRD